MVVVTRPAAVGSAVVGTVVVLAGGDEKQRAAPQRTTTTVEPAPDFAPRTTLTTAVEELIVYSAPGT